jgi:hypothetical protein
MQKSHEPHARGFLFARTVRKIACEKGCAVRSPLDFQKMIA